MKKIFFILTVLIFTSPAFSQINKSSIKLLYSGIKFIIPVGYSVIGSRGSNENFLVFKYSDEPGKKYLAFTKMNKNNIDYKCKLNVFFNDAYMDNKNSICNINELTAFKKIFLSNKDAGKWSNENFEFYYSIGKEDSFLFVVNKSGTVVKIDSDFIDKNGLKLIVDELLKKP